PRTKAIIPVHLYGHPVNMGPILEIAGQHRLRVVEDAAEAIGACYEGDRVGSLGDVGCFSFYGNKVLTTGEGGMITTTNPALAERVAFLKDHGMSKDRRYWHPEIGFNYRLTNLQAAVGLAQLERVEQFIARKRENARCYSSALGAVQGIRVPPEADWARSVYWMYSVLVEDDFGMSRDELMAALRRAGIDTRPFFYPIHTMPPYATGESFPIAEELAGKGLNLPSSATLTETDVERVARAIASLKGGGA
ncbi:MAG: DegT/DnrJ/EryC1/StrS family aminotransferase, partial [Chloroflexi bacterium]|nr:DegT/DnrJ/EryC1/StrS family aminotransferase [Chloroflexota bacterium]